MCRIKAEISSDRVTKAIGTAAGLGFVCHLRDTAWLGAALESRDLYCRSFP